MDIKRTVIVFDASDMESESAFWAALMDGTVDKDEDWHSIHVNGQPFMAVQLAPDHVAPDWPEGSPPQQIHVDLRVDDIESADREVQALGARLLRAQEGENWRVYADPAGHPFCLCFARITTARRARQR